MPIANLNRSYFDEIGYNYSNSLSLEVAELQRTIYLPLLPMEKLSIKVLQAYETLGRSYWFKDDVYTAELGNFYIPMMFPMVENTPESIELIHNNPNTKNISTSNKGYGTEQYTTRSFVEIVIPRFIVMQFHNIIPRGTKFCVGFIGGKTDTESMKILSVAKTITTETTEFDTVIDMAGLNQTVVTNKVRENLKKIDDETARRNRMKEEYDNARDKAVNNKQGRIRQK